MGGVGRFGRVGGGSFCRLGVLRVLVCVVYLSVYSYGGPSIQNRTEQMRTEEKMGPAYLPTLSLPVLRCLYMCVFIVNIARAGRRGRGSGGEAGWREREGEGAGKGGRKGGVDSHIPCQSWSWIVGGMGLSSYGLGWVLCGHGGVYMIYEERPNCSLDLNPRVRRDS